VSVFDASYSAGIVNEDTRPGSGATGPRGGPIEPFALHGCVLTPEEALDTGWVVVGADGLIEYVGFREPAGVERRFHTEGVILPGLIDLHGHPEFNVFPPWEPPAMYANRYEWRSSPIYHQLIREPEDRLLANLAPGTQARYAEIRALVAGTTAIQGASQKYPDPQAALVRNVDLNIFGQHRARALIDLPGDGQSLDELNQILAAIRAGAVDALYIHLAEGRSDDPRSQGEFARLIQLGGLTPATIVIHGCALSRDQFGDLRDAGGKLVWSPQSNMRLYGQTTSVLDALRLGLPVGLGADWLPTGSPSLLAELRVARRLLSQQQHPISARELVRMVTVGAAAIAGLSDHLGTIAEGRPADLLVVERNYSDPYESVVNCEPAAIQLVIIGGSCTYGDWQVVRELMGQEVARERFESVVAWGQWMALDARHGGASPGQAAGLADLRAALIGQLPQLGPIFA
jgi:cytosine/adenosine deaminase-related metal-dependent hydrolase